MGQLLLVSHLPASPSARGLRRKERWACGLLSLRERAPQLLACRTTAEGGSTSWLGTDLLFFFFSPPPSPPSWEVGSNRSTEESPVSTEAVKSAQSLERTALCPRRTASGLGSDMSSGIGYGTHASHFLSPSAFPIKRLKITGQSLYNPLQLWKICLPGFFFPNKMREWACWYDRRTSHDYVAALAVSLRGPCHEQCPHWHTILHPEITEDPNEITTILW